MCSQNWFFGFYSAIMGFWGKNFKAVFGTPFPIEKVMFIFVIWRPIQLYKIRFPTKNSVSVFMSISTSSGAKYFQKFAFPIPVHYISKITNLWNPLAPPLGDINICAHWGKTPTRYLLQEYRHVYQAGKSCSKQKNEYALAMFMDIQEAFDSTTLA